MDKNTEANLTVMAHAVELAASVVIKVAGEAVSNTINGERIALPELHTAVAAKIQTTLNAASGVV